MKLVSCQAHSGSSLETLLLLTSNYSHVSVRSERAQAALQSLQNFSSSSRYKLLMTNYKSGKEMHCQMQAFSTEDYHSHRCSSNQGTWDCADLHGTLLALPRHQMALGQWQNRNATCLRNVMHCTGAQTWCLHANTAEISALNLPSHSTVTQIVTFFPPKVKIFFLMSAVGFFPTVLTKRHSSLSFVDSKFAGGLLSCTIFFTLFPQTDSAFSNKFHHIGLISPLFFLFTAEQ